MINNKRFEIGISLASHVYCIAKSGPVKGEYINVQKL